MARYSAQFRNSVLRKLLPPQSKSVSGSVSCGRSPAKFTKSLSPSSPS